MGVRIPSLPQDSFEMSWAQIDLVLDAYDKLPEKFQASSIFKVYPKKRGEDFEDAYQRRMAVREAIVARAWGLS